MVSSLEPSLDYQESFERGKEKQRGPMDLLRNIYWAHRGKIAVSELFYLIKSAPSFVIPIIIANTINIITYPDKYSLTDLWINLAVLTFVILQNIPTHAIHISFMSKAVRHVEAGLRSTLVRKLQQLSLGYYGDMNTGKLQAKVLRDVEAIDFMSRQMLLTVIPAILNLIVVIIITLYSSWIVALFFVLMVPVAFLLVRYFREKLSLGNRRLRQKIEEMSGKVSETVEMLPVTRAHGLEDVEVRKVDRAVERIRMRGYRLDMFEAFFNASNWVSLHLFQVLCLGFTAWLAFNGNMMVGNIVLYMSYFGTIIGTVSQLLNVYPQLAKGFESLHSISEVLLSTETEEYKGRLKPAVIRGAYKFEEVSFAYKDTPRHVLDKFSLEVKAGEKIAFVGESGSGKSTILNLIIGFYKPQSGRILLDGMPLDEIDMQHYRQSLAIVLQNNILFSGTIRENITYGLPTISEEKLLEAVRMANLQDVIDSLPEGLETSIGEHGGKLSGGQRQRIAIARAIVRNPQIIILDEATSALDNASEKRVQEAMDQLMQGRTTFIVAHRLSTIRNVDRIVVMKKGRIVESGTYEELMEKRGEFYQLKNM